LERKPIRRGGIRSAGYDRSRRELEVELDNGRIVTYLNVGDEIARRFLASASPGSFYQDNIKEEYTARER
jgi:KTSC domain